MEVNHYKHFAYFGRVANPFVGTNLNKIKGILLYLFKLTGPFIHGLLDHQWRINKHLSDNRHTIQLPVFFSTLGNILWQRYNCHFCAGTNLAVDIGMTAGYVFLNMPVKRTDKMCEMFNRLIECPVWPFIEMVTF